MTCKKCRVQMKELKGHIFHKKRKWKCPKCNRLKMQEPVGPQGGQNTRSNGSDAVP